jgi:hypothetical protein
VKESNQDRFSIIYISTTDLGVLYKIPGSLN